MVTTRSVGKCIKLALSIPNLQPTLTDDGVPRIFREPNIHSGYRVPYRSWKYYLVSMFQVHNETGNAWSHLLASLVYMYKTCSYAIELDYSNNPQCWGLLTFGFGCTMYAFLSFLAHLLHSKSEVAHYTCFQMDYIGICVYGHGMGTMLFHSSGTKDFYETFGTLYVPILSIFSVAVCICSSHAKMIYTRPYPFRRKLWQIFSGSAHILFFCIPLYYRFYHCFHFTSHCPSGQQAVHFKEGALDESIAPVVPYDSHGGVEEHATDSSSRCEEESTVCSLTPHFTYGFWFVISICLFALHLPEKIFPGRFDLIGHGHQLFHVSIAYTTVKQMEAGYNDLHNMSKQAISMSSPSFVAICWSIVLVILVDLVYIWCVRGKVRRAIKRDATLEKQLNSTNNTSFKTK